MNELLVENTYLSIGSKNILNGSVLTCKTGNITGLLGSNGSGKSMFLRSIFGDASPQECDSFVNGTKINNRRIPSNTLNYLPQQSFIPGNLKITKLLRLFEVDKSVVFQFFPQLLPDMDKRIDELSGGLERLWTALLLIFAPTRFTMLDEPFTHIAPLYIELLIDAINAQKQYKGFIITDHLYQQIMPIADVIYFMKKGQTFLLKNGMDDLILHNYISEQQRS